MDPITLIVTALAAGAASGVTDTASSAVRDAYASLKALVRKRFAGRQAGELVLAEHESAPETWREPLAAQLGAVGADRDADLVAAAQHPGWCPGVRLVLLCPSGRRVPQLGGVS